FAFETFSPDETARLRWSNDAGRLLSIPVVHNARVYAANTAGTLQAYDPFGDVNHQAVELWNSPLTVASPPAVVARNMWPVGDSLLVLDSLGVLRRIQDTGTSGIVLWDSVPTSAAQFNSAPLAVESLNKVYIGRDDGAVQE